MAILHLRTAILRLRTAILHLRAAILQLRGTILLLRGTILLLRAEVVQDRTAGYRRLFWNLQFRTACKTPRFSLSPRLRRLHFQRRPNDTRNIR
jgi:hypothetical protein